MRIRKLIFRWSLVTGSLIALFWTIWYLVAGDVPVITSIELAKNWVYILPFGISHWWDVLVGPVWSTAIILLFTNKRLREEDENLDIADLVAGVVAGVVAGLVVSLNAGLVASLVASLVAGVVASLVVSPVAGLSASLIASLVAGLSAGLVASLVAGLSAGLVASLVFLIGWVPGTSFWNGFWNWLLARR